MPVVATLVAAPRRALTTVDRLRADVGALGRADDQLEIGIQRQSTQIERYCGRVFARETVREQLSAASFGSYALERIPIRSLGDITSVTLNGTAVATGGFDLINPEAGVFRLLDDSAALGPFAQLSSRLAGWDAGWEPGGGMTYGYRRPMRQDLFVEYVGGYVLPLPDGSNAGQVDLPADVEGAVFLAVRAAAQRTDRPSDVASERLGDVAYTYARGAAVSAGLPDDAKALLQPYRRVAL